MSSTSISMPFGISIDDEMRRFGNWLLVWIFLANLPFMAMWFVGAPPRHFEIVTAGFIGLIVKRFPFWLRFTSFVGMTIWSTMKFISGLFSLSISSLVYSVRFFAEIKPSNSMHYLIAGAAIVLILGAAWKLLRRDTNFSTSWMIIAAGLSFFALTALDIFIGRDMRGHYFREAPAGALFGSATQRSGFALRADGKRNLMLVMMESMGIPSKNPEMQKLLFAGYLNSSVVRDRYDIIRGTSPFYNSTTTGEIRELCGHWGDYYEYMNKSNKGCMPFQLQQKGYSTQAVHSFTGDMFKRENWYPHVGFQKMEFQDDLIKDGAENCGGVFPGACDRDVPKLLAKKLKDAKGPTFLYWLTLNSHLPVPSGLNLNVDKCAEFSPFLAAEFPQACRQYLIYRDIETAMVKEITAEDFPDTDILFVGDHMPPYFDRHDRIQYDAENVPWLYLKRKVKSGS
jgi:hypothetical protein